MLHHVCIHEIFTTTGDIYESLDGRGIPFSPPKKKNPPSDERSSIIATSTLFFFFFGLTHVVFYFIPLGIRNWRNKDLLSNLRSRKLDLEYYSCKHAIIRWIIRLHGSLSSFRMDRKYTSHEITFERNDIL